MTRLEQISIAVGIASTVIGAIHWLIKRAEKRAEQKEADRLAAKAIERKLLDLEANYGRLTEELQDVRKDFAQFVQRLLFDK